MKQLVEFAGLPGSGKTFTLESIRNISDSIYCVNTESYYSYQKSINKVVLILNTLFYMVGNIEVLKLIFEMKNPCVSFKYFLRIVFYLSTYKSFINRVRKYETVVVDQGMLQKIWFYFYSNKINVTCGCAEIIRKLIYKNIPENISLKIVFFETPVELAIKRVTTRNSDCFADHMEEKALQDMYSNAIKDRDVLYSIFYDVIYIFKDKNEFDSLVDFIKEK